MPGLRAAHGRGGDGGDGVPHVGLAEVDEADPGLGHAGAGVDQGGLVGDREQYQEGMRIGAWEPPRGFEGGVAGLHRLLRGGQVGADQNVDAGVNLSGHHGGKGSNLQPDPLRTFRPPRVVCSAN